MVLQSAGQRREGLRVQLRAQLGRKEVVSIVVVVGTEVQGGSYDEVGRYFRLEVLVWWSWSCRVCVTCEKLVQGHPELEKPI